MTRSILFIFILLVSTTFAGLAQTPINKQIFDIRQRASAELNTGRYDEALHDYLSNLDLADSLDLPILKIRTRYDLGSFYSFVKDFHQAFAYFFDARAQGIKVAAYGELAIIDDHLAVTYQTKGMADSSRYFLGQSYAEASIYYGLEIPVGILDDLGVTYMELGDKDIAFAYLTRCYKRMRDDHSTDYNNLSETDLGLARIYQDRGQWDSAQALATSALNEARISSSMTSVEGAEKVLAACFEKRKEYPAALAAYKAYTEVKDTLADQEKIRETEILTFQEQLRQVELQREKEREHREEIRNIKIAGIFVFIPIFFLLVAFLRWIRIGPKTIEFLGLVGLLMAFEFITLLIHPKIADWTDEDPILMLCILMGVAAVISPLHHKLEHFVKGRLAKGERPVKGKIPKT